MSKPSGFCTYLTLLAGYTRQNNKSENFSVEAYNFGITQLGLNNLSVAKDFQGRSGIYESSLESYLTRANFNLSDKYLFTLSYRADGSSKFLYNKWGFFPSGAIAWRLSNEEFIKNIELINDLKIRLSYGKIGNEQIPSYGSFASMIPQNWDLHGGQIPGNLGNEGLKWETTSQLNAGFDVTLGNERISTSFDIYSKITTDMLLYSPVPYLSGFTNMWKNVGSMENKGIEVSFSSVNINSKALNWQTDFVFTYNINNITALSDTSGRFLISSGLEQTSDEFLFQVGKPVGEIFGYKAIGVYTLDDFTYTDINGPYTLNPGTPSVGGEKPGAIKYADLNEDGKINSDDRTIIGHSLPKFTGGFTSILTYKGIELFCQFQYSVGNDIYNANLIYLSGNPSSNMLQDFYENRWTINNQNSSQYNKMPKVAANSALIEDGSYLRFKTLRLGYTIPTAFIKKANIGMIKVYVSIDNVHVWTNYSGYDPEISTRTTNNNLPLGLDYGAYPRSQTTMFGMNVTF
jgi:TonB-linked SusC/RagA family outer membrane protein